MYVFTVINSIPESNNITTYTGFNKSYNAKTENLEESWS